MQKKQFLQIVRRHLSAHGYRQISPVCFDKNICESMSYRMLFIFSGRVIVETTPLFGFNFPEVESFLQSEAQEKHLFNEEKSKFPTIFKQIDRYIYTDQNGIFPQNIMEFDSHRLAKLSEMANNIETLIPNQLKMCEYINVNYGFPVGHHAYRIPVLLSMNNDFLGAKSYEMYVESLDFIENYSNNLRMLPI